MIFLLDFVIVVCVSGSCCISVRLGDIVARNKSD
jgi:hypothetical protein